MNEFKRVIFRRRYLVTVILLYILNAVIFQCSQADTLAIFDDDISFPIFVEELKDRQNEEHEEFYGKLDKISEEKERLLGISIFADKDSFAYKDIIKTYSDYTGLSDVVLSDTNDYAVNEVLEYRYMYPIGLLIIVLTVFAFVDDKKRGLGEVVYSCRNGRMVLSAKRIIILFLVSFVTMALLITSVLAISFMDYGGADILTAAVQSVGKLQNFVLPVSLLWFFVYFILYMSVAYTVCGLVVWMILSVIRNRNLAIIVCVLVYGAEYFLYSFIPKGLTISIFRYTNLWFLLEPGEIYREYTNFPFFGGLLNLREYMDCAVVIMLVIMCIIALVSGTILRPCYAGGLIGRYAESAADCGRRLLCRLNGLGYEFFKQLILRKGIVIIIVFGCVLLAWVDNVELIISPGREMLDEFYDEYTGRMDELSLEAYENIHKQVADIDFNENEPGNNLEFMFSQLMKQKEHADVLEKRGIEGWFLNDRGYERLFGRNGDVSRTVESILAVVSIVLIASFTYVTEYVSGAGVLIRSAKRGRGTVFRRKSIYVLFMTIIIWGAKIAADLYDVSLKYKLEGWSAPVQNIMELGDVRYSAGIGGFIGLWYATGLSILFACSCITMLVSVNGRSIGKVCVTALILSPVGVLWQYIVTYLASAPLLLTAVIPLITGVLISVGCLYMTYRKWDY